MCMYVYVYIHIHIRICIQIYIYIYIYIYGSFSFVGLKANEKECALWSHSTWARAQALKRAQGGP